jgi:hypothetical protein
MASSQADSNHHWPWVALQYPAVTCDDEGPVESLHAVALHWSVEEASRALGELLERAVRLVRTGAPATAQTFRPAFGATLSITGGPESVAVVLDAQAARLLVNTLTSANASMTAPAAPGPVATLTAVEQGLLEYIAVSVLDRILRHAPVDAADISLVGLHDEATASDVLRGRAIDLDLHASGTTGLIRVAIDGWSDRQWSALMAMGATPPRAERQRVRLALPPIPLLPAELDALDAGDVLLAGAKDLQHLSPCRPFPCCRPSSTRWTPETCCSPAPRTCSIFPHRVVSSPTSAGSSPKQPYARTTPPICSSPPAP